MTLENLRAAVALGLKDLEEGNFIEVDEDELKDLADEIKAKGHQSIGECFSRLPSKPDCDLRVKRGDVADSFFTCHHERHIDVFTSADDDLKIVRVLHQHMDLDQHLKEEIQRRP